MKMPWSNFTGPARLLVICATVLLIASGLCGMEGYVFAKNIQINPALSDIFVALSIASAIAILLSLLVGAYAILALIWKALTKN
jgi:hypothetical protein